jgi:hypothetical protein
MHHFAEHALSAVAETYPTDFDRYDKLAICSAYLPHAHSVLGFQETGPTNDNLVQDRLLFYITMVGIYHGAGLRRPLTVQR